MVRALLLALLCLAGCTSLPTIVPDLSRRAGIPVQVTGARGPLSAAQSRAILERLKARGPETGIFDRHLALEEAIAGSPLTSGNRVLLLQDGPATYPDLSAVFPCASRMQRAAAELSGVQALGARDQRPFAGRAHGVTSGALLALPASAPSACIRACQPSSAHLMRPG